MKKSTTFVFLFSTLLLAFTPGAQADNTICTGAIRLVPDGSAHESAIANEVRWYRFLARPNRSYVIALENLSSGDILPLLSVQNMHTVDCMGAAPTSTDVGFTEPNGINQAVGAGRRSLTVASETEVFFSVNPNSMNPGSLRIRIEETTLFSPRWSTFGGFYTTWGFQNTTNTDLSVTLRVFTAGNPSPIATSTFAVNANTVVFRDTRPTDLDLAAGQAGSVVVTHNGPPGAILMDGFMTNENGTVFVTVPVKSETARQMR